MATVTALFFPSLNHLAELNPIMSILSIKAMIAGPRISTFVINASHSLARAPITIMINRTVEIFPAVGSSDWVNFWNFVCIRSPKPTGMAVIKNMVIHNSKRLMGGASLPIKYIIEIPVIIGSVRTVMILMIAV